MVKKALDANGLKVGDKVTYNNRDHAVELYSLHKLPWIAIGATGTVVAIEPQETLAGVSTTCVLVKLDKPIPGEKFLAFKGYKAGEALWLVPGTLDVIPATSKPASRRKVKAKVA